MSARLLVVSLALAAAASCEDVPGNLPPGSCTAGERLCYFEARQQRELVLRCNDGEVAGAIWLIEDVCVDDELCQDGACVLPETPAP